MTPRRKNYCLACHCRIEPSGNPNELPVCNDCLTNLRENATWQEKFDFTLRMRQLMATERNTEAQERIANFLDTFQGWYEQHTRGDEDEGNYPFNLFGGRN